MKYRRVMNRWFAPAAVTKLQPTVTRLAQETVAPLVAAGECDFMSTFGDQFPVKVFLASMGLPISETADFFVSVVHRMSGGFNDPDKQEQLMAAWGELAQFWEDLIVERRKRPLDPDVDFVTHLTRSNLGDRPLPDEDIKDLCVTLTIGSLDTLKSQLGWCFWHLATHDDDRRRLVAEPDLVPTAVEEFLRAYPIVSMARKVTRDVDFHGCPMKKDQMVLLTIQAATRDPRVFPDADKVVIDRQPNRHIAFGASEHRCLGSHLARSELVTAIKEWNLAIPEYRVATDEPLPAYGGQVGLLALPLTWR